MCIKGNDHHDHIWSRSYRRDNHWSSRSNHLFRLDLSLIIISHWSDQTDREFINSKNKLNPLSMRKHELWRCAESSTIYKQKCSNLNFIKIIGPNEERIHAVLLCTNVCWFHRVESLLTSSPLDLINESERRNR